MRFEEQQVQLSAASQESLYEALISSFPAARGEEFSVSAAVTQGMPRRVRLHRRA